MKPDFSQIDLSKIEFKCRGCLADLKSRLNMISWTTKIVKKQTFWIAVCPDCNKKSYFWKNEKGDFFWKNKLHFVIVNPKIIGNVGTIIRLSCAYDATVHLVEPFGFIYDQKVLKRTSAGHFDLADKHIHHSWEDFLASNPNGEFLLTSSRATVMLPDFDLQALEKPLYFVFGNESDGLPSAIMGMKHGHPIKIPQTNLANCINLAQSVAVFGYQFLLSYDFFTI